MVTKLTVVTKESSNGDGLSSNTMSASFASFSVFLLPIAAEVVNTHWKRLDIVQQTQMYDLYLLRTFLLSIVRVF
jgi:hypothetical protein